MSAQLLTAVSYTDTHGKTKAALVIGTPESTNGRIPEDQVTLTIFNPINGRRYFRYAAMHEDGTYHNRDEHQSQDYVNEDAGPFPDEDDTDE